MKRERLTKGMFLILGRAGLDLYADPPGTRIEDARGFFPALGGSAANIASAIARLGSSAALLTTVSDDAVGRYVVAQLKHYGVGTDHVRFVKGEERTSLAVVETRAENCQSVLYRNNAADFALTVQDVSALDYQNAAALIVTGTSLAIEPSRSASFEAFKRARAASCPVILDIDYRPYSWSSRDEAASICGEAARQTDILIGNDEEFSVLAGHDDGLSFARALADKHGALVVYKRGEKGSHRFCRRRVSWDGNLSCKSAQAYRRWRCFFGRICYRAGARLHCERESSARHRVCRTCCHACRMFACQSN